MSKQNYEVISTMTDTGIRHYKLIEDKPRIGDKCITPEETLEDIVTKEDLELAHLGNYIVVIPFIVPVK